ncbi:LysR family transcriptional regulator [Marinoscillum sp.]|uniref:LysR family transcriptional regulator n=1 Tax=Marinoscillum sp. TaxID=2024838 RepID=UPI003BAAF732
MNYTLHQLQIFVEVVRKQSITKAAEVLHMTQPALSIQLKNFQNQFDIPLTEAVGRKIMITDFGYSIAEIAKTVLNEAEAIKFRTKEYSNLLRGSLRISSASTGKYVIPYFLNDFIQSNPGIDLVLDVSNKSAVVAQLERNEIDFAFFSVPPINIPVNEELLLENKLYLVGAKNTSKAKKPLIFREKGSATRLAMDAYFENKDKRKSMELTSNEAVKQAVIAGLGHSILPLIGLKNELTNGDLSIIPSRGLPITTTWRLGWHKNKNLSPVAKAYLEFIRERKDEIIKKHFSWYTEFEKVASSKKA